MKEIPTVFSTRMAIANLNEIKTCTRRLKGLNLVNNSPDDWDVIPGGDAEGWWIFTNRKTEDRCILRNPYGIVGDILWQREAWATEARLDNLAPRDIGNASEIPLWYRADSDLEQRSLLCRGKWRPSIFMPRWACRCLLRRTSNRGPERLQLISPRDCLAEGLEPARDEDWGDFWATHDGEGWECSRCGGDGYVEYSDSPDLWGEDCPSEENHLLPCPECREIRYDALTIIMRDKFQSLWDSINAERGYSWDFNPWVWPVEYVEALLMRGEE